MRIFTVAVLLLACGSGCVDMSERDITVDSERTLSDDARALTDDLDRSPGEEPDVCELLPDEGACAYACDVATLAEDYVPVGACAVFVCELDDGRVIHVHACHPHDD